MARQRAQNPVSNPAKAPEASKAPEVKKKKNNVSSEYQDLVNLDFTKIPDMKLPPTPKEIEEAEQKKAAEEKAKKEKEKAAKNGGKVEEKEEEEDLPNEVKDPEEVKKAIEEVKIPMLLYFFDCYVYRLRLRLIRLRRVTFRIRFLFRFSRLSLSMLWLL